MAPVTWNSGVIHMHDKRRYRQGEIASKTCPVNVIYRDLELSAIEEHGILRTSSLLILQSALPRAL